MGQSGQQGVKNVLAKVSTYFNKAFKLTLPVGRKVLVFRQEMDICQQ